MEIRTARFHDRKDLQTQLRQWLDEVNNERPSRATGEIPQQRRQQEFAPLATAAGESPTGLALRIPIQVSVTAEVSFDGRSYAMPPEAVGMSGNVVSVPRPARSSDAVHDQQAPADRMGRCPA